MGKITLLDRLKDAIGWCAWRVFLWSKHKTEEDYWGEVYESEKIYREQMADECRRVISERVFG